MNPEQLVTQATGASPMSSAMSGSGFWVVLLAAWREGRL